MTKIDYEKLSIIQYSKGTYDELNNYFDHLARTGLIQNKLYNEIIRYLKDKEKNDRKKKIPRLLSSSIIDD